MVEKQTQTTPTSSAGTAVHPLDPLSLAEIETAVGILKQKHSLGETLHFDTVVLKEPPKKEVLSFSPGSDFEREAFIIVLNYNTGHTYEAVVSLTRREIVSCEHVPSIRPRLMVENFLEWEAAVKRDPRFIAVLKKRGVTDPDLVMIDPWPAPDFGDEEEKGRRLAIGRCWVRRQKDDNGYARPIEGLTLLLDLNKSEIVKLNEFGIVPIPPNDGNYAAKFRDEFRSDIKPLEITQPEGPSFQVTGNEVRWQKWRMRVGFTPREGLVLYTIGYEDQGQVRSIIYRASLSEMVVPYGDPTADHYKKQVFDAGEIGMGHCANSLELGCDCLGEIRYFDVALHDVRGEPREIKNGICLHEEDFGILWKHRDFRLKETEVRRSRRLVISNIATVGNYEYGYFWYFYQDGTIEYQVKLTGIVNTAAVPPGVTPKHGTLVAPQVVAHNHQHYFNVRLDMMVDGIQNSVFEVDTVREPLGEENPHGNAFSIRRTLISSESEAQRIIDPFAARYWAITNPSRQNYLDQPVSYQLVPGENVLPFHHEQALIMKRAAFMTRHLWVTPYDENERYAAGNYPYQHPGGDGLPKWMSKNRDLENTDVVVWYTFGHNHIPRPEDWPVMPVAYTGFSLKPSGFFDENPALDVPPSTNHPGYTGNCHQG